MNNISLSMIIYKWGKKEQPLSINWSCQSLIICDDKKVVKFGNTIVGKIILGDNSGTNLTNKVIEYVCTKR